MGIYTRPDSKWWWIYNEKTKKKVPTEIPVGTTSAQRRDSKQRAEDWYHKVMLGQADATATVRPAIAITAFAQWFNDNILEHRDGVERDRLALKHVVRFCAAKKLVELTEITADHLPEYASWRKKHPTVIAHFGGKNGKPRTLKPPLHRTINRETAVFKSMLMAAVPTYLAASPLAGKPFLDYTPAVPRMLTDAERARLLPALPHDWDRAIFLIGYEGLVRLTNILDMKKTDREKDLDGKQWLWIRNPKMDTPYKIQLSKAIIDALDALPVNASEYLFPQRRGAQLERNRRGAFATMLRRAAGRVRVPWGQKRGGTVFHWATRTTGMTRMIDQGGEGVIKAVAQMGNWKNAETPLGIYYQVKPKDLDAIVERLNKDNAQKAKAGRKGKGRARPTGRKSAAHSRKSATHSRLLPVKHQHG